MGVQWKIRAAGQMARDGIRSAYRRGPKILCAHVSGGIGCANKARYETREGARCFTHAIPAECGQ